MPAGVGSTCTKRCIYYVPTSLAEYVIPIHVVQGRRGKRCDARNRPVLSCRRDFTVCACSSNARQSLPPVPPTLPLGFSRGKSVTVRCARAHSLVCSWCLCVRAGGRRTRKRPRSVTSAAAAAAAAHYTGWYFERLTLDFEHFDFFSFRQPRRMSVLSRSMFTSEP